MKTNKTNSNNSINTYRTKKIISLILAATSIFSLASCKSEESKKDYTASPEISSSTFVEGDNEKYDEIFTEEKLTEIKNEVIEEIIKDETIKEEIIEEDIVYDDVINYDGIINGILKQEYKSNYKLFNDYNIQEKPSLEKEQIIAQNLGSVMNESDYANRNYDWYKNGKVDADKLYNIILKNNIKKTIFNDDQTKLIAKTVADVAQTNLDFMKKKYPNYNLDIALYGINNLTVIDYASGDFICFMDYGKDRIYVNFNNISDVSTLKYSVSHELFHLIFCNSLYRDDVIIAGSGIDPQNTLESPLYHAFLNELCVESYSYEAFDKEDPCDYWDNYMLVDLLCLSTGKDKQYFKDCFVNNNKQGLINCFENGLNTFDISNSIYDAIDISLGYGELTKDLQNRSDFDISSVQGEALNYAQFNLYKNLLIRLSNELKEGKITYEEAEYQIIDFKNSIYNIEVNITWINSDKNNYSDSIDKLDEQFYKLQKNKIYA